MDPVVAPKSRVGSISKHGPQALHNQNRSGTPISSTQQDGGSHRRQQKQLIVEEGAAMCTGRQFLAP